MIENRLGCHIFAICEDERERKKRENSGGYLDTRKVEKMDCSASSRELCYALGGIIITPEGFAVKDCHLVREGLTFASRSDWLNSRQGQRTHGFQRVRWDTREVGKIARSESSSELCYLLGGISKDLLNELENVQKKMRSFKVIHNFHSFSLPPTPPLLLQLYFYMRQEKIWVRYLSEATRLWSGDPAIRNMNQIW